MESSTTNPKPVKMRNSVNAFLDCGTYRVPLQGIDYWARGVFAVGILDEFKTVMTGWERFKEKTGIESDYKAESVRYDDQMNLRLNYATQPDLDVFYITCGHPEGEYSKRVAELFELMEIHNVCAPISANDPRIVLEDKV